MRRWTLLTIFLFAVATSSRAQDYQEYPRRPLGLITELVKVLEQQDVKERLTAQGVDVQSSTIEELAELIRVDAIRWAKLVKVAGLVLE